LKLLRVPPGAVSGWPPRAAAPGSQRGALGVPPSLGRRRGRRALSRREGPGTARSPSACRLGCARLLSVRCAFAPARCPGDLGAWPSRSGARGDFEPSARLPDSARDRLSPSPLPPALSPQRTPASPLPRHSRSSPTALSPHPLPPSSPSCAAPHASSASLRDRPWSDGVTRAKTLRERARGERKQAGRSDGSSHFAVTRTKTLTGREGMDGVTAQ
jgi:hypothetical protein